MNPAITTKISLRQTHLEMTWKAAMFLPEIVLDLMRERNENRQRLKDNFPF